MKCKDCKYFHFIDDYRIESEIESNGLYIYKRMAFYDYIVKRVEMPEFWRKYLLEKKDVDKEIELKFEEYIIKKLGLKKES